MRFALKESFCRFCDLSFKKASKNPSKTRSEPLKNRCQKHLVFQRLFSRVSVSIWEPLGPPSWSQVGHFGTKKLIGGALWAPLKLDVFQKWYLGGLLARFWNALASILEPPGLNFRVSLLEPSVQHRHRSNF